MLNKAQISLVLYPQAVQALAQVNPVDGAVAALRQALADAGKTETDYVIENSNDGKVTITAPALGASAEGLPALMREDSKAGTQRVFANLDPVIDTLIDSGAPPMMAGYPSVVDNLEVAPTLDELRDFEAISKGVSASIGDILMEKMEQRYGAQMDEDNDVNYDGDEFRYN